MDKSEFNEKLLQEVEKLEINNSCKNIIKKLLKYEITSRGRYEFDDYDKVFEEELDNNDNI